jgi:hypothetical protein
LQLDQQKYQQNQDKIARTKDQNSFIFQRQASLYFDAAQAAATIALAASDNKIVDQKSLNEAKARFKELYLGQLVLVEDRRVELAMIAFGRCLDSATGTCKRPTQTQSGRMVQDLAPASLVNLSLELSACTRSALEEDRGIQFGEVKKSLTVCPYD